MKNIMAMKKSEVRKLMKEMEDRAVAGGVPDDCTYLMVIFGPTDNPVCQGVHNIGSQTALPVKKFIEHFVNTIEGC